MICRTTNGKIQFKAYLPHASNVELVGDFTEWRNAPVAMRRESSGWWVADVEVAAGEYHFCYLVDSSIFLADYAAHGVKLNQYGGWISRVMVDSVTAKPEMVAA